MAELVAEQRAAVRALEDRLCDPALTFESRDVLLARLLCADHDSDTARGLSSPEAKGRTPAR